MRKQILSLLLCAVLILGLCVPALGAYNGDVTVRASLDKTGLEYDGEHDQTVRVTVSLSREVEIFSMSMKADVPEGLTLTGIDGAFTRLEEGSHYNLSTGRISWYAADNLSAKDLVVLTVTVPAGTPSGSYTIGVESVKLATSNENDEKNWMNGAGAYATLKLGGDSSSYTVHFDANGGKGRMADVTVPAGNYTLPECTFTAPEGKEYKAWQIGGREYQPNSVYKVNSDTLVVALWKDEEARETVATPKLPRAGKFSDTKTITITCATKGASIYYTTDGTEPDDDSERYTEAFTIKETTTVKAIAIKEGMNDSEVASATYTKSGSEEAIRVTMRLIGAELAEEDVDLGKVEYLPDYVTWIRTTEYELEEGAMVYDLWVKATEDAGIRSVGANKNYVSTVYAPDSLGGYALSEFTNGKRSGWMYTINGKHPGYGLKEQELEDGDEVIWHYVNDYSYEVDDWFSEGEWKALGDGTYYNLWLKAPDRFGGKGGGLSEKEENLPRFENGIVILEAETESGTATAELDEETVETGLKKSRDRQQLTVRIESGKATRIILNISSGAVETIADAGNALRVETDKGSITLSSRDVSALVKKGKKVRIEAADQSGSAVKLSATVGGATADVTMKVELPARSGQVLAYAEGDGSLKVIRKSLVDGGSAYGELPSGSTVKVVENAKSFRDVKRSDWFAGAVDFASSHELFQGVGEGEFAPKNQMTRAMLVTVLYRLEDAPDAASLIRFGDVKDGEWYTEAVKWAAGEGIVRGNGEGFAPNDNVTREQIATILYRYAEYLGLDVSDRSSLDAFYDGEKVSDWAKDAMQWAVKLGLFQGDDTGSLNPKNNATRAEVATLMQRIVAYLVK